MQTWSCLMSLGIYNHKDKMSFLAYVQDAVPRASLGNLSRLVDEVVVGLARGKCCKARILLRNLTARGRAKCRRPSEYFPVEEIPEQCQEVLDL